MIETTDRESSDGKKSNSEKMLRSSVTPKSSTATIVSLTEKETVNSPVTKSLTMKSPCLKIFLAKCLAEKRCKTKI